MGGPSVESLEKGFAGTEFARVLEPIDGVLKNPGTEEVSSGVLLPGLGAAGFEGLGATGRAGLGLVDRAGGAGAGPFPPGMGFFVVSGGGGLEASPFFE